MKTYTVSGNTFAHREMLKQMNGRWNNTTRTWTVRTDNVAPLQRLIGVLITPHRDALLDAMLQMDERPAFKRPDKTVVYGDDPTYLDYFKDKNPAAFFGFNSLREMLDYVEALERPEHSDDPTVARDVGWHETPRRIERTGTASLPAAIDLARRGWSDGLGLLDKLSAPRARAKRRLHGTAGGTVNVGRLLAGNPAHMRRRKPLPHKRSITLFVETVMWRGITAYNAQMRALVVASMIDRLETEGYLCDVIAVMSSLTRQWQPCHQTTVRLKRAGERLNLLDISFALGHPSFLRRLSFAIAGACPEVETVRGIIGEAFDDKYVCKPNEFYVPQLSPMAQRLMTDDPLSMLEYIEPDGLPVSLRE